MLVIFTIVVIIFFVINKYIYRNTWNYLNVFLLIWYIASMLSRYGFYDFYVPSEKTYIYILVALISLEAFSILFMKITIKKGILKNDNKQYKMKYMNITIMAAIITALMIPTTIRGIEILMAEGFDYLRGAGFSTDTYSSMEKIFLVYIIKPLNITLLVYSMIDFIDNNKIKLNLILCIINVFQDILTFGGRASLLSVVLLFAIILVDKYGKKIYIIFKKNKKIIIASILIIGVIIYITSQRQVHGGKGLLFNIYSYYVGSIHLFGLYVDNPNISLLDGNHLLYGQETINPITEMINILGGFFGISLTTGIEIVNEVTQKFVYASPDVLMNNNVTMLYAFLRDFDIYGLIIGPMLVAAVYAFAYKRRKKTGELKWRAVYYYVLAQLPYFLFENVLAKGNVVFNIIFIIVLSRIIYKDRKDVDDKEKIKLD